MTGKKRAVLTGLGKRGEEYVEASMVLPVLILTMITVMTASLFMLESAFRIKDAEIEAVEEAASSKKLTGVIKSSGSEEMKMKGKFTGVLRKKRGTRVYAIRQARAIRIGERIG